MSTMAYWNGMTWGVSMSEVAFLDKLVTGYSYQTQTNADKDGESPTENVGMKDMEISFTTTYRVETGTPDIRGKIQQWGSMVGQAAPLIIGGSVFGPDKMQLQDVSITETTIDARGVFRAAVISFKFVEYKEKAESGTTSSSSDSGGSGETAVSVGASSSSKKTKKTVTMQNTSNNTAVVTSTRKVKDVDVGGKVAFK